MDMDNYNNDIKYMFNNDISIIKHIKKYDGKLNNGLNRYNAVLNNIFEVLENDNNMVTHYLREKNTIKLGVPISNLKEATIIKENLNPYYDVLGFENENHLLWIKIYVYEKYFI